jgi:drug/metabolite transporter (DMT)-like permease
MKAQQKKDTETQKNMTWLLFALMTVGAWGVYGILLHEGALGMKDPEFGRYKAFLWVGVAYFVTAVLAPLILLIFSGAGWQMSFRGSAYSFVAGIVGAIGAFGVLLAFGAKGHPAVVMSIIFAGAPVVNALVAIALHPPGDGWGSVSPLFWLGIGMAVLGGCLVTLKKPGPAKKPAVEMTAAQAVSASSTESTGGGDRDLQSD